MDSNWAPLIVLAGVFFPLLLLERWLGRHLRGLGLLLTQDQQVAILLWYLVLLPGVVLHELSHWLAAQLVGVKTHGLSLRPRRSRGSVTFGSVQIRATDPIRESWIGLAPLLSGSAAILLIARRQFGIPALGALWPAALPENLLAYIQTPDAWLWVYLVFAISNAMMPSESDRRPWLLGLVFLAVVGAFFYVMGLAPEMIPSAREWGLSGIELLTFALAVALVVDVPVAVLLFLAEKLLEVITHRHVQYG
jgi:hypothetical protein